MKKFIFNQSKLPDWLGKALILASVLLFVSCKTLMPKYNVIGIYVNQQTGEFFEFREDNQVSYHLNLDEQGLVFDQGIAAGDQERHYQGRYKVNRSGSVRLILTASHLGLFAYEFSESWDKLYITHRLTGRVTLLQKM